MLNCSLGEKEIEHMGFFFPLFPWSLFFQRPLKIIKKMTSSKLWVGTQQQQQQLLLQPQLQHEKNHFIIKVKGIKAKASLCHFPSHFRSIKHGNAQIKLHFPFYP